MIELIDVTARQKGRNEELKDFNLIIRDGEIRRFNREFGELIINVILGFLPVSEGLICFDGMPLSDRSVAFLRKMMAYIPSVDLFQNVGNKQRKQLDMLAEALQSEAQIMLAVEPFQYLNDSQMTEAMSAFKEKAQQNCIVVIATDMQSLLEI